MGALAMAALAFAPVVSAQASSGLSASAGPFAARGPVATPLGLAAPSGQRPFPGPVGTASPWTPVTNAPFVPGTMLLASDGTVLVHEEPASGGTANWWRLTPTKTGSYTAGSWSKLPAMPGGYNPLYFASAILPDGRLIVEGGEYLGGTETWTNKGAIYSPTTNTWKTVAPPTGWTNVGDAQSAMLANGRFMMGQPCSNCTTGATLTTAQALLNPSTLTWTATGGGKGDPNDEEGWNLEPSGQLLTVDAWTPPKSELYTPSSGTWKTGPSTVNQIINTPARELGPQVVMPGGNTLVIGGGTAAPPQSNACSATTRANTALYHYKAGTNGTWTAGPTIPTFGGAQYDSADGPGAILPNGNILFIVSRCTYLAPAHFFVYNRTTNTLTQVGDTPDAPNDSTYYTRMLELPTGQILFASGASTTLQVYTAGGTAAAAWKPTITTSPAAVTRASTYSLSGTQLAGLSQGAAYGDDAQSNTNFPLVRIRNNATGVVTYARTTAWSSMSINPGTSSSTRFTVPTTTPTGPSTIVVVANGIPSAAKAITVS